MNPFMNPKKRSVSLPPGCKDLIDVLKQKLRTQDLKVAITAEGFLITAWLPGLRSEDLAITVEHNIIRIAGNKAGSPAPFESAIDVPAGYNISRARIAYSNGELRIMIPKP